MKKSVVVGSLGQIGTELVWRLRNDCGEEAVLATDVRPDSGGTLGGGPFELLDARNGARLHELAASFGADTIIHMAGILSATAEANPQAAWDVNINGVYNALEAARSLGCSVFFPSSIAAFGPDTPKSHTPQDTLQRPNTVYGVTKVTGELLCDYYYHKWGLDTRGLRFPGLISHAAPPGGGTTDYAVHIYYDAVKHGEYTSFIAPGTYMDMMYMPDAIDGIIGLMEADPARLRHRCCFNITAMSFCPEDMEAAIREHIPGFKLHYDVDPVRQAIADSWPDSLDDSAARDEWGWSPRYNLASMTSDMLARLRTKV